MRKDVEYKLKGGRTYVAHYDRNSVCKVRKATLELLFAELDESYEQAKILEKIKENYALFRATANKWIPVGERLPEEDGEYLATIYDMDENHEYMDIAEFEDGKWQYKNFIKVLAWMPLPEPYKGGETK